MLNEPLTFVFFAVIAISLAFYFKLLLELKTSSEIKLLTYLETSTKKSVKKEKRSVKRKEEPAEPEAESSPARKMECQHFVGYLTSLPKGSSFPEECFGCRKVIQCLRVEPTQVIESFYMSTPEIEDQV